jgi:ADP-ribosylglycohydrolase
MPSTLPPDYEERVYAGVLGKIIGVYLGRPFEGWGYEQIMRELGEINYYVHEQRGQPLVVTDDDISGTFTFVRALPDSGNSRDLTARQIGQTWLNYLIERQTILWWGGMGNSTEHTAFYRLKSGIEAPRSGSIALNGRTVAEQIGAQIFIDGWAMVSPGDPEQAADLAGKAASVSHDGEAKYGAQVIAALEAQAFVESDLNTLLDTAVRFIPKDSVIYRLIGDVREWHDADGNWRKTRERIVENYGYDKYIGNCHMVPNHALILLGLLYGEDDFQKSLMITNTCGWDTDCNSGNVGCIMGIKNGLAGINAGPDWRGPVADRLYLPTADGGSCITDAVTETYKLVNIGRALAGAAPVAPKNGARYHFELPGSLHGFCVDDSLDSKGTATIENVEGHSREGKRSLAIRYKGLAPVRVARVGTATFIPPDAAKMGGYSLIACPTLYPGQLVTIGFHTDPANSGPIRVTPYYKVYGKDDKLEIHRIPAQEPFSGSCKIEWRESGFSNPIAEVGIEISSESRADGTVYLDSLTWERAPEVIFKEPETGGAMWRRAWVHACNNGEMWGNQYRVMQDDGEGFGLLIQGTREWRDYEVQATITPRLLRYGGIAVCVQGCKRWVGLLFVEGGRIQLVKALDGERVLAETELDWKLDQPYDLSLTTRGGNYVGKVNGKVVLEATDTNAPLESGALAFVVEAGRLDSGPVSIRPVEPEGK